MDALKLYENIKTAWQCSSRSRNYFAELIAETRWDYTFIADDEYYFIKGDITLSAESLDPFDPSCNPNIMFSDGSMRFLAER